MLHTGICPGASNDAFLHIKLAENGIQPSIVKSVVQLLLNDEIFTLIIFEFVNYQRFLGPDDRMRNRKLEMSIDGYLSLLEGIIDEHNRKADTTGKAANRPIILDQTMKYVSGFPNRVWVPGNR